MASILDSFPYPFAVAEAQQLHRKLADKFPNVRAAETLARNAGVDTTFVDMQQAVYLVWKEILEQSANGGHTRTLVQQIFDGLSESDPYKPFFAALLQDVTPATDNEPRNADGTAQFIANSDTVTKPEELLYKDDLTLSIGRLPRLIQTLQRMLELAPSICRFDVDMNGTPAYGSGFRIAPDLLLTNWHVFHHKTTGVRATAVTAEFGYEYDGAGTALPPVSIPCDIDSIVTNKEDDWAIIRPKVAIEDKWPIIKLSEAVEPKVESSAFIIQHPMGTRKRIGYVRNQVSAFDARVVHYLTDTQEGSSGSPVFNDDGQLIALHHAGGKPQDLTGKAPVKKNEGIRISRIVAGLAAAGVTVP